MRSQLVVSRPIGSWNPDSERWPYRIGDTHCFGGIFRRVHLLFAGSTDGPLAVPSAREIGTGVLDSSFLDRMELFPQARPAYRTWAGLRLRQLSRTRSRPACSTAIWENPALLPN